MEDVRNLSEEGGLRHKRETAAGLLGIVLLLAFMVRVIALFNLDSLYVNFLLYDEHLYHNWAASIADGTYQSTSVYEYSPVPAYLWALVFKVFAPSPHYVRFFNIVFNVLTCLLIYHIGKALHGRTLGLLSSLIAAVYKPFIFYSIVPLKTSLSVFLFALVIYLVLNVRRENFRARLFFLGITLGLALNTRGNMVILPPFLLGAFLFLSARGGFPGREKVRGCLFLALGLASIVLPVVIRNYTVGGEMSLSTSQGGVNLYIANSPSNETPYYRPVSFASPVPFLQGVHFTIEASRRTGKRLGPQEASRYWRSEAAALMKEQPGAFLRKLARKAVALIHPFEAGDHYNVDFMSDEALPFLRLPFLTYRIILPFAMLGLFWSTPGSRKCSLIALLLLAYASTLVLFFPTARMRLPLLVGLIPFASLGVTESINAFHKKRKHRMASASFIVAVFLFLGVLPLKGTDDMAAYCNAHALILDRNGREEEAQSFWETSSQTKKPLSAYADLSLARINERKGDVSEAFRYLERIPEHSFAAADKWELLGDIYSSQKKHDLAKEHYEKCLKINSGLLEVRKKLIEIYRETGDDRTQGEEEALQYVQSFYNVW